MDTKAFVQDTVSRSLNKYLELHPDGGVPAGGTEGQALVKKSNADGDVEWADINIPDGWGVAKSGVAVVNFNNSEWGTATTVNISDLGFTSNAYYTLTEPASGGTAGGWGSCKTYVEGQTATALTIGARAESSVTGTLNVKYVIFAEGYGGGAGGVSLPKGGTTGQILAKASDNDGDAYWISNAGSDLVKYGRQYGSYAPSAPITQLVATEGEPASIQANTYEIPIVGCLTSIVNKATLEENKEAFTNAITNAFDIYVEVEDEGSERKLESLASSTGSSIWWIMNPRKDNFEYFSYLFAGVENGKIKLYCSYRYGANQSLRASVGSVRLVAKNGNNFGISTGTDPKYIRNLTGMVLDDLGITGSNIPTGWGVAEIKNIKMQMTNKQSYQYIWLGDYGFTSVDDYAIFVDITGGTNAAWGKPNVIISNKSATEAGISLECDSAEAEWFNVNYVIIGKGYGNLTQNSGSSIPAGYSPMQIEMVDSNGVTHKYEFLGKEITP